MLQQIGVESYMVLTHSSREWSRPISPPMLSFNHAILAIRLPDSVPRDKALAVLDHPSSAGCSSSTQPVHLLRWDLCLDIYKAGAAFWYSRPAVSLIDFPAELPSANIIQRNAKVFAHRSGRDPRSHRRGAHR